MKIVIKADGRSYRGTALQIVEQMKDMSFGGDDSSISEYLDRSVEMAERMTGAKLSVDGDSDDQRASSFVASMLENGLAKMV